MLALVSAVALLCLPGGEGQGSPSFGSVRLVGTDGSTSVSVGRLEIYYNVNGSPTSPSSWGTICRLGFEITDANVACQELGFLYAADASGVENFGLDGGPGTMWLSGVQCSRDDTRLADCSFFSPPSCEVTAVAVRCTNESDPLRLVSQTGQIGGSAGRLDIFIGNLWGTVCHNSFDKRTADVACRQLGFSDGAISVNTATNLGYVTPEGVIWLTDVACTFTSGGANLRTCGHRTTALHSCGHEDDVILSCLTEGSVRLVTSMSTDIFTPYGRLEVYVNGRWGTVCGDGFRNTSALVACKQLGFSHAGSFDTILTQSEFPSAPSAEDILLDNVACTDTDLTLLSCSHNGIGMHNCRHFDDVVLFCGDFDAGDVPQVPTVAPTEPCSNRGAIRINGVSPVVGIVEVCLGGLWGTVCAYRWRVADTQVICRQLGRQLGVEIAESVHLENGFAAETAYNTPTLLSDPGCSGSEAKLVDCSHFTSDYCPYNGVIAVACIPSDSSLSLLPNCTDSDFQCRNGLCVANSTICNDRNDCGDNSDETVPGCQTLDNREYFREQREKKGNEYLAVTLGASLGLVAGILLLWLAVLGACMLLPRCPLKRLYSHKAHVPHPDVVRMNQEIPREGGGERREDTGEHQLETSAAPLFT